MNTKPQENGRECDCVLEKGFIFLLSYSNQTMLLKYFSSVFIGIDLLGWYTNENNAKEYTLKD